MNTALLYQWTSEIDKHFPILGRWQRLTLALLSYGVVVAGRCGLWQVAQQVSGEQKTSSLERRFQRWLANERVSMAGLFPLWVRWVLSQWGQAAWLVLVDETKLSTHVSVMVVSLYYQGSALPLIWRAYAPDDYPLEGQVGLLSDLLQRLRAWIPPERDVLLLADRGLGTSPAWQHILSQQGWDYLLRVQGSTRLRLSERSVQPLRRLVGYGQRWFGYGQVFKKAGWQWRTVFVIWEFGYAEPWCLVSNRRDTNPLVYAWRFSQEASFRDLKSDGFAWQRSHVWSPAHVERLVLVLALATFWTLASGTIVVSMHPLTRRQQRQSIFRLGLDYLFTRLRSFKPACLELYLVPDTPLLKSVVQ